MPGSMKFRRDLQVFKYDDVAGNESVVLKDPVSGKYYYLSVYEYALLKTLDGHRSLEQAVEGLTRAGHYYSLEDAQAMVAKASQLGLLLGTKYGTAEAQAQLRRHIQEAKKSTRLSSVYFLFIPLVNPDRFLQDTLWLAKLIANRLTLLILACALPAAMYMILSETARLQGAYLFFFNWDNLLYLWITLAFTKLIHELAHAYTAKYFGLDVPQMGVAFLIFFPCLYCNTTDAWQLADRKQRIAISAAGILSEGALAILSTYIWYFTKPGIANSLAFYLMAISFISTVLFNGNPLMRFDGYFVLMDLLRLPNLYTRSFGYTRYLFMNRVLGIAAVPNPATTRREVAIFTIYGISAFVYRVFLYTSIVLGVYYRFDKLVGVVLAVVAFSLFIVRPLLKGMKTIFIRRKELRPRPAGIIAFSMLVFALLVILLIPISRKSLYFCYVASVKVRKLTIPLQTSVKDVFVREGSQVPAGTLLGTLDPSLLRLTLRQKEIRREVLLTEIKYLLLDYKKMEQAARKQLELSQLEDEIRRTKKDLYKAENGIVAPFDGIVTALDFRFQDGFQPGEGVVVGEFESLRDCAVRALVPEKDLDKVHKGQENQIWFDIGTGMILKGRFDEIKPYSEQDLNNLPFSSRFGGEVATEAHGEDRPDVPLEAYYQCSVFFDNSDKKLPLGMTGHLVVRSPSQSILGSAFNRLLQTFNREALF